MSGIASAEKHRSTALAAAAILGYAEKSGWPLPRPIPQLSLSATYGLAAWAYARWQRSLWAEHAATGLLSCAIRDLTSGRVVPTSAVLGDEDGVGVVYEDD